MPFGIGRGKGKNGDSTTVPPPHADGRQSYQTERTLTPYDGANKPSGYQLHRATRTRQIWALLTAFFLLFTVIFLILVEVANTHNKPVLTSIWFIKLDLSNVVPTSVPNAVLLNSIAQTLGLHDFYQVGLWNFCEGYNGQGVTDCSTPQTLYWFNPVQIILNELLSGATLALPSGINDALSLLKEASQWMFGLFLTGACLSFVLIFVVPLSLYTRWATFPIAILTFVNALVITVASVLGTVMFVILRNVFVGQTDVNIQATLGAKMFAFMWIASAFSILTWLVQMGLCCCCASRRDVKRGKKRGSKKAWEINGTTSDEKPRRRWGLFKRKSPV